jgi:hypothetical protein
MNIGGLPGCGSGHERLGFAEFRMGGSIAHSGRRRLSLRWNQLPRMPSRAGTSRSQSAEIKTKLTRFSSCPGWVLSKLAERP